MLALSAIAFALSLPSAALAADPDLRVTADIPHAVASGIPVPVLVTVRNVGDATASGTLTMTAEVSGDVQLPDGLQMTGGSVNTDKHPDAKIDQGPATCEADAGSLTCSMPVQFVTGAAATWQLDLSIAPDAEGPIDLSLTASGDVLGGPRVFEESMPVDEPFPFGFDDAEVRFTAPDGGPATQAASTPVDFDTRLAFAAKNFLFANAVPIMAPPEHPRDIVTRLPVGLLANPSAADRCTDAQLSAYKFNLTKCPPDSQIGLLHAFVGGISFMTPLYNMVAPPGAPGALGANINGVPIKLVARLRDSDYGIDVLAPKTNTTLTVTMASAMVWGVPAHSRWDGMRDNGLTTPNKIDVSCIGWSGGQGGLCPTAAPRRAFTRLPTSCSGDPLAFSASMDSYESPGSFAHRSFTGPVLTGCEDVPFDPSLSLSPSSPVAGAPSGLDVVLSMPQHSNPDGLAQADLRRARVTLPEGMTINPASAGGLGACSDAQLRIGQPGPATCPGAAKIGTVAVKTPLLDHPLDGAVYVRSQGSNDPASGEMFRIAVIVRSDQDGIHMKLPGSVVADPQTGRLTTTFANTPQLPFSEFRLHFKGGSRAPLVMPDSCGTHQVDVELEGWNGALRTPPASFELDQGCAPAGFDPQFDAGSVSPLAGVFSPFVTRIVRRDGDRDLGRVNVTLPKGVLADLSGVELCTDSQIAQASGRTGRAAQAAPVCPAGSQIGTTTVGAGAGPTPFYPRLPGSQASGRVFLTEAYTQTQFHLPGVPQPAFGLAIEVPAVAGPYDLGDVVVRAALYIDPETAQATVLSDPLPRIVKGVPLHVQDVRVDIDRPRFATNPTSCAAKRVEGDIRDAAERAALRSSSFQVADCGRLAFKPRLRMRLAGRRQMRSGGHPAIRAVLTQPQHQAGIAATQVRLPSSLALDPERAESDSLCEWRESLKPEPNCPASSIIGHAKAVTPLLDEPLEGPVYFAKRKRINRFGREISTLPSLVIALRGQIAINLRGNTDVKPGSLVTTFASIPDAPVSRFELSLAGARKGILLVTKTNRGRRIDLCASRQVARVDIDAHNGRRADQRVALKTSCPKRAARRAGRRQR
jgi:hypothetical protein